MVEDFNLQQAQFESSVASNLALKRQFASMSLKNIALNTEARFINATTMPISKPNYVNYAIQGINLGLSVYGATRTPSAPKTGT